MKYKFNPNKSSSTEVISCKKTKWSELIKRHYIKEETRVTYPPNTLQKVVTTQKEI
jgi:hypothetical protein